MAGKRDYSSDYVTGFYVPHQKEIRFKGTWSGHDFTGEEIGQLLAGNEIDIDCISRKTGNRFAVIGKLEQKYYNGRPYYGFQPDFSKRAVPLEWGSYSFSEAERHALRTGRFIMVHGYSRNGNKYNAFLTWNERTGIESDVEVEYD